MKQIILILVLIGLGSTKDLLRQEEANTYISKTYFYMGDTFKSHYNAQIDSANYSWKDSVVNGNLLTRYYPKYQGFYEKTEKYFYTETNQLEKKLVEHRYQGGHLLKDSTLYNYKNDTLFEVLEFKRDISPFKEIHRISNDTTFIDEIINGKYAFTRMIFKNDKGEEYRQRIKPEVDSVLHIYKYNEFGDIIAVDRYENGSFISHSIIYKYKYDRKNRVIEKETYYDDELNLGHKEITLYE